MPRIKMCTKSTVKSGLRPNKIILISDYVGTCTSRSFHSDHATGVDCQNSESKNDNGRR